MQHWKTRGLLTFGAVLAVLTTVACGGGGSGSSPTPVTNPTPTPITITPTPVPTPITTTAASSACQTTACAYTFTSNPSGIAVSVNGASIGVTPVTVNLNFSSTPQTVTFGTGYSTTVDQTSNVAQTIFYNSVSDTGSVSLTGNQSVTRSLKFTAPHGLANELRRGVRAHDRTPAIATDGVYVRYTSMKLGGRSVQSIESSAGASSGTDIASPIAATRGRVVHTAPGQDVRALAAKLAADPAVASVSPLHYRAALGTRTTRTATAQTVSDLHFLDTATTNDQWSLVKIGAPYAWTYTHGANAKIAIIDTGVDLTHPDLPTSKVIYQATTVGGLSTAAGAAQDTNGHGTNVAGIAAADTNDASGTGFAGVGYGAKILAYRIFPPATATSDQQSASTGDEAAAIADAVAQGADVINLSIGATQYDPVLGVGFDQGEHDAIENAIAAGVTVVAAAGNEGQSGVTTVDYPGAYDGVISVGASALDDRKNLDNYAQATEYVADFSNTGPTLSIVAPGGDIDLSGDQSSADFLHWIFNDSTQTAALSTDQCRVAALPDVCKALFIGTSQATPHVSGSVALIQSARRENGLAPLAPAQMKTLLEGTADNIGDPKQGHGRLNVLRAIESTLGVPQTFPAAASSPTQFVAFAYTNSGAVNAAPAIADITYRKGQPLTSAGTFRIADVPSGVTTYRIGVWFDSNGDGIVDAGDQFGAATITCSGNQPCQPGTIAVAPITSANFTLP